MRNPLSQCSGCSSVILYTISTTRLSNRIFQTASSGCKWMPRGALVCSPPRASGSEERTRTARPWTWSLMPNVQQGCDARFGGAFSKGCPSFFSCYQRLRTDCDPCYTFGTFFSLSETWIWSIRGSSKSHHSLGSSVSRRSPPDPVFSARLPVTIRYVDVDTRSGPSPPVKFMRGSRDASRKGARFCFCFRCCSIYLSVPSIVLRYSCQC